jgi:VAD1 Analog of StAR-related lipid transfer domain/GRAM domain/C2 domain
MDHLISSSRRGVQARASVNNKVVWKSSICEQSLISPRWGEECVVDCRATKKVKLSLFDWIKVGADKKIGSCAIYLDELKPKRDTKLWLELRLPRRAAGFSPGEICVSVLFIPATHHRGGTGSGGASKRNAMKTMSQSAASRSAGSVRSASSSGVFSPHVLEAARLQSRAVNQARQRGLTADDGGAAPADAIAIASADSSSSSSLESTTASTTTSSSSSEDGEEGEESTDSEETEADPETLSSVANAAASSSAAKTSRGRADSLRARQRRARAASTDVAFVEGKQRRKRSGSASKRVMHWLAKQTLAHKRMKKKTHAFRQAFDVDDELIVDFPSAYHRADRVDVLGRLYISSRHVAFYSNAFGAITSILLPIADLQEIRRVPLPAAGESALSLSPSSVTSGASATPKAIDDHDGKCVELVAASDGTRYCFCTRKSKLANHFFRALEAAWRNEHSKAAAFGVFSIDDVATDDMLMSDDDGGDGSNAIVDDDDDDEIELDNGTYLSVDARNAGFLRQADQAQCSICVSIDDALPCSVADFYRLFVADSARQFAADYHTAAEHLSVRVGKWTADHRESGARVRQLSYQALTQCKRSLPRARMDEIQRAVVTPDRLVVESIRVMLDVRYGDFFRVESQLAVSATESGQCTCQVRIGPYFMKLPPGDVRRVLTSRWNSRVHQEFSTFFMRARRTLLSASGGGERVPSLNRLRQVAPRSFVQRRLHPLLSFRTAVLGALLLIALALFRIERRLDALELN